MSEPPISGDPTSQRIDELLQRAHELYTKALQGNPSDLDFAIAHYRGALGVIWNLSSDAHSQLLGDFANVLVMRFQQQGSRADLACAMECHLAGLALRPIGHPMRMITLMDFATALLIRFKEDSTLSDIHLAIDNFAAALSLCPFEHPARCALIMKSANAFLSRFENCGDAEDLERAIEQYQSVVELSPPRERLAPLSNLANALQSRFHRFHELNDLQLSIQHSCAALHLLPTYHPARPQILRTLAGGFFERFHQKGDTVDLETARRYCQALLDLCSQEHPYHTLALNNLADILLARFQHQGDPIDLDLAIGHYRTACIHSEGQPDQGMHLDHLGNAQLLQFRQCGDMADLHRAIENHTLALELHPLGHQCRPATLAALASCLDVRFEQQGELADLKTALNCYNDALTLCPENHRRRPVILNNIAAALEMYFRQYNDLNDLNRCIAYYREALDLYPTTHVDRPVTLTGLACALLSRFELLGNEFDIDQALLHCTVALDARSLGHPARPASLLTMAKILRSRFLPWDDPKKLDAVFEHLRAAKDACQPGHSLLLDIHAELSMIHFLRYLVLQHSMDLKEAFGYHELSMAFGSGGIWVAFRASLYWVQSAEMFRHASAVDAYRTALRLLDRCVIVAKAPELRRELTRRHAELMLDAFSAAIRHKQPDLAVEMLEQGRLLLWTQLALHRSILDDLRSCGEQGARLADNFEQLNHRLERGQQHHREVQKQRDAVITQIRRLDGFSHFLMHPSYADIQKAARDGPVIVVNASQYLCNAIIIFTTGQPALVPLPKITLADVARLASLFHDIVRYSGDPDPGRDRERRLINLLTELWDLVVSPVVDRLLPHTPKGSRIWWCPTGKFAALPLHAAGLHHGIELNLSQLYISSYAPTLLSLIKSRRTKSSNTPRRSSFVPSLTNFLKGRKGKSSRPSTPILTSSTFAAICSDEKTEDIDMLRKVLPLTCTMTRITGANATYEHAIRAIREQPWIHFASRAEPNFDLPFESHFPLHDKPMSLLEIAQTLAEVERPPEFAFLSVSHGSSGTERHETMHFPHALHLAGFQSVVGTMWAVDEEVTRRIASAFYHSVVVESRGAVNCTNAAKALSQALKMVEEGIPLEQRIAFVHVGV
ncbi:CHAT domain-containing protein [Suillus clintonianus]|uniref:CHAT domain-containing protein n=1 Tax=Suillus clintonianus TaxID=1904413 RepID=UPI001B87B2CD|nr:CHAT domain-containing protein [Suillus clintonianus]KAG2115626.1 CHAT domain-containing protein [Suillus clintonianus]